MIAASIAVTAIAVSTIGVLVRGGRVRAFLLAALLVAVAALVVNASLAGTYADEHGLAGNDVGWFGDWWWAVLGALILALLGTAVSGRGKK